MSEHPDLIAARSALAAGDAAPIIRIALRSRERMLDGVYCECSNPLLVDPDLMCGACLRRSRYQEIKAVTRIVGAHDFVPGKCGGYFCAVCVGPESWPRHHGVPAVGRTSWGTEFVPGEATR